MGPDMITMEVWKLSNNPSSVDRKWIDNHRLNTQVWICNLRTPAIFTILVPTNHIFPFLVDFPRLDQRSMTTLAPPGVLIQVPQLPSHHMAKLPSGTTSSSISSVQPCSPPGKVAKIP